LDFGPIGLGITHKAKVQLAQYAGLVEILSVSPDSHFREGIPMKCSQCVMSVVVVGLFFSLASAAPPTMDEIRQAYDVAKYQPAIRMINQCLSLKGPAAAGYSRYELITLKGECLIRLKSATYAADAFEDAQAATTDAGQHAAAMATELLLRQSGSLKYTPKSGTSRAPIDVVEPESRKRAMKAMRDDVMAALSPKVDDALKADVLTPMLELLPRFREAAVLEYGATGGVEELRPVLTKVGTRARELIVHELKVKAAEVEQLNEAANEIDFDNDHASRRGFTSVERKNMAAMVEYLRQIESVGREGRRIAEMLGGNVPAWEAIVSDVGDQVIRIESILRRPM